VKKLQTACKQRGGKFFRNALLDAMVRGGMLTANLSRYSEVKLKRQN
jgi:hypothetical protein